VQNYSNANNTCWADNPDAATTSYSTCDPFRTFGASCIPGYQDQLCFPAGGDQFGWTSYCAPTKNGGGSCAPKCQ
jgi:hypothetical protein